MTRIIEEAARTLVLSRFTRLSAADIESKATLGDPDDVVTIVDEEVEAYLTRAFATLTPGAAIVGEESVHRQPAGLARISSSDPVWVIDPIDGTKNFVNSETGFGTMVAWVVDGHARAAWVVLPARQQTYVAEAGGGAFLNGERIHVPGTSRKLPRGPVNVRFMPQGLGEQVLRAMSGRFHPVSPSGCAAVEYTDVIRGERDFAIYYRLLPWDHAAPGLILTEAGGCVAHATGGYYTARSGDQVTIVARSAEVARSVCDCLAPLCS